MTVIDHPRSTSSEVASDFVPVCSLLELTYDRGVAARIEGHQIAVFALTPTDPDHDPLVYAIDNFDPCSGAHVLSRGLVGSIGDRDVVASPLYKEHYDLRTGECLERSDCSIRSHSVRIRDGIIEVRLLRTAAVGRS